jgi:hypothetical protein
LKFLPEDIRKLIEEEGVKAALELTYYLTKNYIPQHFVDELHGLADASKIGFKIFDGFHVSLYLNLFL